MKPTVSIIVPVYNAEKTIRRCIDSLLCQTYAQLEIFLVNDGSKDDSLRILKEYETQDSRVHVLSHENRGAGQSRNAGIDQATGEFITFVDADDYVEADFISALMQASDGMDTVIAGLKRVMKKKDGTEKLIFSKKPVNHIWTEFKYTCTMAKLYRLSYLNEQSIRYSDFKFQEDMLFCMSAFSKTQKIKIIPNDSYVNCYNEDSITTTIHQEKKVIPLLPLLKKMKETLDFTKYQNETMILFFYYKNIVQNVIMQVDVLSNSKMTQEYLQNYKWLEELSSSGHIPFHWQKKEEFTINLLCNTLLLFTKIHCVSPFLWLLKKAAFIRMK